MDGGRAHRLSDCRHHLGRIDAEQAKETLHILLKYQTDIAKAAKELSDA